MHCDHCDQLVGKEGAGCFAFHWFVMCILSIMVCLPSSCCQYVLWLWLFLDIFFTIERRHIHYNILKFFTYTVESHFLLVQGTLWNTSKYPYLDISDWQNWGKIKQLHFTTEYLIYWKYCGKEEQFLLFSTIFCHLKLDFHTTGTRFSLRDKQLLKISKVEKTRVDCNYIIKTPVRGLYTSYYCHRVKVYDTLVLPCGTSRLL